MIDITIRITGDELGEVERNVLAALTGQTLREEFRTPEQTDQAIEEFKAAVEQPKRTRRTKAEMEAARAANNHAGPSSSGGSAEEPTWNGDVKSPRLEEPEFTDAQAAEEPVTEEQPEGTATLEDAVKKATELVAANRVGELKSVLTEMGARRVSELKGDQITVFLGKFAA